MAAVCLGALGCGAASESAEPAEEIGTTRQESLYCSSGDYGWAWAHAESSASYTPNTDYSFNEAGGSIGITRSAVGRYAVKFGGLARIGGNAQVVAYGDTTARCKVVGWGPSGTDQAVNVACTSRTGAAADSKFVVMYGAMEPGDCADAAYVWASDGGASHAPFAAWSYNSAGGSNYVTRTAKGQYRVRLGSLNTPNGHPIVTAYGPDATHCKPTSWTAAGADVAVYVRCQDAAGALADSQFSLRYQFEGVGGGVDTGYAWLDQKTNASYTPDSRYRYNSRAGTNTAKRTATGRYLVEYDKLRYKDAAAFVSSYDDNGNYCKLKEWRGGDTIATVYADCYTPAGARVDSKYNSFIVSVRQATQICNGDVCATVP